MIYLQWLVHGRPDALKPTEESLAKQRKKYLNIMPKMNGRKLSNMLDCKATFTLNESINYRLMIGTDCGVFYRSCLHSEGKE